MSERIKSHSQQEKEIAKIIFNIREQSLKDEQAQQLREHWIQSASQISSEIKDQIGILWMTEILE